MGETALVLLDIQNDFMPGGALPVREGRAVVPVANRLMPRFAVVAATQDWHPEGHVSFASQHPGKAPFEEVDAPHGLRQILWPDHCVQGTQGADFVEGLDLRPVQAIFRKGTDPTIDSYSGFFDNGHRRTTGLADWLRAFDVEAVTLVGVAADVCVFYTARDALDLGFATHVVEDGTRGVEANPGDVARAFDQLRSLGAHLVPSSDVRETGAAA
jgi:nicotinamidase/pyrazinamidase